jgi:hypothetical protein
LGYDIQLFYQLRFCHLIESYTPPHD